MEVQYTVNNFIKAYFIHKGAGGCFITIGTIELENGVVLRNAEFKIDTGAQTTMIPLARYMDLECAEFKAYDLNTGVRKTLMYGIESTGTKIKKPITFDDYMACQHVVFEHKTKRFRIRGIELGVRAVDVSYDRRGNILLGMDVLKDWDIHIGKSVISDRIVFLGCPRDRINPQYLEALEKEFKLGTTINSNRIYRGLNTSS